MHVESVFLYPVKATKGIPVSKADVELSGLKNDRRWAIVDLDGKRLNATHQDTLLSVSAVPDDAGNLTLRAEGRDSLAVNVPVDGPLIGVNISRLSHAVDAGDGAAAWFSDCLGKPVRLVWQDDPAKRSMSASHGGNGDESLSLADAGPLLLATTKSLEQLNDWIGDDEMVMERFRPNVVIDGVDEPFVEDNWRHVRLGGVPYRFAEQCDRCVVTTIDPWTLRHGNEPTRTLARYRKWDGKTWFGIRIVPLSPGTLGIGDEVTVEEPRPQAIASRQGPAARQ